MFFIAPAKTLVGLPPYHVPMNSEPIIFHEKCSFSTTTQTEKNLLKADVPVAVLRTLFQVNLGASGVSRNSTAPQNFIYFCGLLILRMQMCELTAWKQSYILDGLPFLHLNQLGICNSATPRYPQDPLFLTEVPTGSFAGPLKGWMNYISETPPGQYRVNPYKGF